MLNNRNLIKEEFKLPITMSDEYGDAMTQDNYHLKEIEILKSSLRRLERIKLEIDTRKNKKS